MLYGTAMNMVKLESCKTGKEQWDFVYAMDNGIDTWIGQNVLKKKDWKKIDLNIANKFSGIFKTTRLRPLPVTNTRLNTTTKQTTIKLLFCN